MQIVQPGPGQGAVGDQLVLLHEVTDECWTVATAVRFGEERGLLVMGFVLWKSARGQFMLLPVHLRSRQAVTWDDRYKSPDSSHLLFKPCLRKMPKRHGSMRSRVSREIRILTPGSPNKERSILLRDTMREIRHTSPRIRIVSIRRRQIYRDISRSIVRVSDLVWLVNIEDIDFIVPSTDKISKGE